jgi:hypothetical protein
LPFALIGGAVGFFSHGNMRVAGLLLNLLALIPAAILLVLFVGGTGLAGLRATRGPEQPITVKEYKLGEEMRFGGGCCCRLHRGRLASCGNGSEKHPFASGLYLRAKGQLQRA